MIEATPTPKTPPHGLIRLPGAASSPRRVALWLQPQRVLLDVDLRDRHHAIERAADEAARMLGLDAGTVYRALWRREQIGSTALGSDVAIPHARGGGIEHPVALFMRARHAIDFDAPDGKPVACILMILVPAEGDTDDHLQMLALIAQMFSDRALRRAVANADTAAQVERAFTECIHRIA